MSHDLREAFHELAGHADVSSRRAEPSVRSDQLWSQGRRARRRRAVRSALVAGVVLLLAGSVIPPVVEEMTGSTAPATYDDAGLAVPDQVWTPSSWAPTADEEHPPGPLAFVGRAPRRSPWLVSEDEEWFAVSAADQSYRWLDLPGRSTDHPDWVTLSPDGRRIGYFLSGSPSGRVVQSEIVGYAVYDTVTGEVTERRVHTKHGLSADPWHLVWAPGSDRLVATYGQYQKMIGASRFSVTEAWDPDDGSVTILQSSAAYGVDQFGPGPDGAVVGWRRNKLSVVSVSTAEESRVQVRRGPSHMQPSPPRYNPSGTRLAFIDGRPMRDGGSVAALHVAELRPDGSVGPVRELAPAWMAEIVLGWTDDRTVLVTAQRFNYRGLEAAPTLILAYDVVAGTVSRAIARPGESQALWDLQPATDLLQAPLAGGTKPPWHLPPWPWITTAGLLLGVLGLLIRRRRHRRGELALPGGGAA